MARSDFETLRVYKLSEDLADSIWNIVVVWNDFARATVGGQLVRAADSVGANIAEGRGRRDTRDHKRFVRVAWGSLNETQHFLRRAYKRGLLTPDEIVKLRPLVDELGPSLNAYHQSLSPQRKSSPGS